MLSPSVFKAYDVRGIVPDELDAAGAERLAAAYVAAFEPEIMAIGHDMRLSSPDITAAAIRGASNAGADVVDLGQIGTEMLYFAVGEYGYHGGIQVTASHNPAAYNGMKMVRRGAQPVGGDTGLDRIKSIALGELPEPARIRHGDAARRLPGLHRPGHEVHRPVGHQAARGGARRCQRDVGADDHAGARTASPRHPPLLAGSGWQLPKPRAQPAPGGEPPVHHREGARARRRPRHRVGRRRRPLLLHRRHRRVRAGRPHHRAHRRAHAEDPPGRHHRL